MSSCDAERKKSDFTTEIPLCAEQIAESRTPSSGGQWRPGFAQAGHFGPAQERLPRRLSPNDLLSAKSASVVKCIL